MLTSFKSVTSSEGKVALAHPTSKHRDANTERREHTLLHRMHLAEITVMEQKHQGRNIIATCFYFIDAFATQVSFIVTIMSNTQRSEEKKIKHNWTMISH